MKYLWFYGLISSVSKPVHTKMHSHAQNLYQRCKVISLILRLYRMEQLTSLVVWVFSSKFSGPFRMWTPIHKILSFAFVEKFPSSLSISLILNFYLGAVDCTLCSWWEEGGSRRNPCKGQWFCHLATLFLWCNNKCLVLDRIQPSITVASGL